MTEGSSQGLFVIVAVVIFGIFVVISYLLFRDKLQTGLADIFSDSILQSKNNLDGNILKNSAIKSRVTRYAEGEYFKLSGNNIRMKTVDNSATGGWFGIQYWDEEIKPKTTYRISFDFVVVGGSVKSMGGHTNGQYYFSDLKSFSINGVPIKDINSSSLSNGIEYDFKNGENYKIEMELETKDFDINGDTTYYGFYIQPNRLVSYSSFEVEVNNINIIKK